MSKVSIICGSAFSKRAGEVVREFFASFPKVIIVVPTQRYATRWERTILEDLGLNCLTGRYVYDFTNFAKALLEEEIGKCELIEVWKQELIVKSILLSKAGKDKLTVYSLQSPENLAPHLVEIIRNLKQGGVEPEEFIRSIPNDFRGAREEIIYWVYSRYQEIMHKNNWFDVPGMFWMVEEICKHKKLRLLEDVDKLLLEGFDDFTNSELRLLKALGDKICELKIFLNYDLSPGKQDIYRLSARTLQRLKEIFNPEVIVLESNPPKQRIEFIAQNLYWRDLPQKINLDKGRIRVSFYPNRDTEIRECAREIKRLIIEEKVSPSKIALVFRKLEPVRKIIEKIFEEFNIPFEMQINKRFKETIVGQFLFNWFSHLLDDKVLSLLQIFHDPFWNLPLEIRLRVSYILRLLEINLNHPIGILEERLKEPTPKKVVPVDEEEGASSENGAVSEEMINSFRSEVERWLIWRYKFKACQSTSDLVNTIEALLKEIWEKGHFLDLQNDRWVVVENRMGIQLFLNELRNLLPLFDSSFDNINSLVEIICQLIDGVMINMKLGGGVFISELPSIRNLKFDYVFLCGVERGSIPFHRGLNALYSEKELSNISLKYNIPVETIETHFLRERTLFQKTFESAEQGIYLSFSLFSEVNSECEPSLLIRDVLELCNVLDYDCGYKEGTFSMTGLTSPCSERELRLVKFYSSTSSELEREFSDKYPCVTAYKERLRNEPGPYFGRISTSELLEYIRNLYGDRHIYSVDQIERYIDCPFLFFAKRVLSLSEWERDTEEPPPYLLGSWVHKVLHRLLRDYLPSLISRVDMKEVISEIIEDVIESDLRSKFFPRGIIQVLKRRLKILVEAMITDSLVSDGWLPTYFELSFGETKYEEGEEPLGNVPPFEWKIDDRKVLFSGRIDRVDLGEKGGLKVAKVVDYKFRKVPKQTTGRANEISCENISSIQLTLYGLVVEQHLLSSENVKTVAGSFFIVYPEGGSRYREVKAKWSEDKDLIQNWRVETGKKVISVIDGIRNGYFVPQPREDAICERCRWLVACKYRKSLHEAEGDETIENEGSSE